MRCEFVIRASVIDAEAILDEAMMRRDVVASIAERRVVVAPNTSDTSVVDARVVAVNTVVRRDVVAREEVVEARPRRRHARFLIVGVDRVARALIQKIEHQVPKITTPSPNHAIDLAREIDLLRDTAARREGKQLL